MLQKTRANKQRCESTLIRIIKNENWAVFGKFYRSVMFNQSRYWISWLTSLGFYCFNELILVWIKLNRQEWLLNLMCNSQLKDNRLCFLSASNYTTIPVLIRDGPYELIIGTGNEQTHWFVKCHPSEPTDHLSHPRTSHHCGLLPNSGEKEQHCRTSGPRCTRHYCTKEKGFSAAFTFSTTYLLSF